jgi:hypothetical protein
MSGLLLAIAMTVALGLLLTECLIARIPQSLQRMARDNCYRIDGTLSSRRVTIESKARHKLRTDLWAMFALLAFSGHFLLVGIHVCVIPIPLGWDALLAFEPDTDVWREKLQSQGGVGDQYFSWLRRDRSIASHEDQQAFGRLLWKSWPIVIVIAAVCLVFSFKLGKWSYRQAMHEYATGVRKRQKKYLDLDLARLQDSP